MSRRRHTNSPFWQDNVLHVPTSPFMSPVQSPVASPIHSPLVSPRNRRNQSPDVDIASAILTSMNATNPVMSIDELLASFAASRGVFVVDGEEEEEEEDEEQNENNSAPAAAAGTANNPIDLDEEEGGQYHLDRSVQRAYEDFLRQVQQQDRSTSPLTPPPPPPPSSRRSMLTPLRMPPPPPSAASSRRRPTNLRVLTNRRSTVAVRLPTGGYTFARTSPSGTLLVSPRRTRRRSTQTLSVSHRPLIRQVVTVSDADMRRRIARNRVQRYTRQLTARARPEVAPASFTQVPGFQLTESLGIPSGKCAICLEEYKLGDTVSYVACQPENGGKDHLFHTECIETWVVSAHQSSGVFVRTCPVCRGEF